MKVWKIASRWSENGNLESSVLELFKNSYKSISEKISGYTVSDEITKQTIAEVYQKDHYILDPHGAVAYYALEDYLKSHQGK